MKGPTTPIVVRVAEGDITRAKATLLVVNHFNGLTPSGAEGAIDACLGGAIARRAARGEMESRFGGCRFLPATRAPLSADAVLVLGLGDPEKFIPARLPELGAALVEAAATFGIRDAATVVHAAGTTEIGTETATRLFMDGILEARVKVPGADCFLELTIVERLASKLPAIQQGLAKARGSSRVHLYLDVLKLPVYSAEPVADEDEAVDVVPRHLRIGITRAGSSLKVTVIGHGGFDIAGECPYPADEATRVFRNLKNEVLLVDKPRSRSKALTAIGHQLAEQFLRAPELELPSLTDQLKNWKGKYLILRLDRWTVDLPWEIALFGSEFLSRTHLMSRQLEINSPGGPAPTAPIGQTIKILVVGDPTGDLPAARDEGEAIFTRLRGLPQITVKSLIGDVAYADVSRELDTTQYDVMHYAGHARFDAEWHDRGGFELADQTLTAEDLSSRRYLLRVVFANACQSAQTGAEANPFAGGTQTIDLVTGLLRSGVRGFVGSMWNIDDDDAKTFADAFYNGLLTPSNDDQPRGSPIGVIVAKARAAVIKQHGVGQPAWAGYALSGSPWLRVL
jgi:CHAT domain/Cytosol aminopeptidase family, N-terminal domain